MYHYNASELKERAKGQDTKIDEGELFACNIW
jgi:hypothetical protein